MEKLIRYMAFLAFLVSCNGIIKETKIKSDTSFINHLDIVPKVILKDSVIDTIQESSPYGIWIYESAVLADKINLNEDEKISLVKDKRIEISKNKLVVLGNCQSEINISRVSSLKYWGSENTFKYQKTAFKKIGLDLEDSLSIIQNRRLDAGCDPPFSELVFTKDKIISTMYPYIISFVRINHECISSKSDLNLPIDYPKLRNSKILTLNCTISELEKLRCGNESINYYLLPFYKKFTIAIFQQKCGDSEYLTLVTLNGTQPIDQKNIFKVEETELNGKQGLNFTNFIINDSFDILLKHSSKIINENDSMNKSEERLYINDLGKIKIK